ncbi:unnamed protein product [Phaeothamnion confervicola]
MRRQTGGSNADAVAAAELKQARAAAAVKKAAARHAEASVDVEAVERDVAAARAAARSGAALRAGLAGLATLRAEREAVEAERFRRLTATLHAVNRELGTVSASPGGIMSGLGIGGKKAAAGDCYLSFSPERSILFGEGVAMLARPERGSTWRCLGQLSGGQQALCGLALNVAVQQVRPASLYILDEASSKRVDAALDTHNVAKAANLLQQHASAAAHGGSGLHRTGGGSSEGGGGGSSTGDGSGGGPPGAQLVVISHRPEMLQCCRFAVGLYGAGGTTRAASVRLG